MLESIKAYPLIWALTAVLLVAAIAFWCAAMKKRKKNAAHHTPERLLSAQDLEKLKTSFQTLEAEKLLELKGDETLLFAVITNIEYRLDQGEEADTFAALTTEQQYVYTLWYFAQGLPTQREMCDFFHEYGEPLTTLITPALLAVGEEKLAEIAGAAAEAFDENNEEASADTSTVASLNAAFRQSYDRIGYYHSAAEFVRLNVEKFIG